MRLIKSLQELIMQMFTNKTNRPRRKIADNKQTTYIGQKIK